VSEATLLAASGLGLPIVDALELDEEHRRLLLPDETIVDRQGELRLLPRFFLAVDSWETARKTRLAEHFTLHELITVDVREAPALRRFPRFVPTAVMLLAAHLELLRQAVDAPVWISANGGYRSPAHKLTASGSVHCWGTAANIYRVGDELLDTKERIERFGEIAARVSPAFWIRPYGPDRGFADDHLHVDVGYVRLTPREYGDGEAR
jgi:hypothetical protein